MGGKPRTKPRVAGMVLRVQVRPRVAPLGWPHRVGLDGVVRYEWAWIKPDGSGWTRGDALDCWFPEGRLEEVIEAFYAGSGGSWPFDFIVEAKDAAPEPEPLSRRRTRPCVDCGSTKPHRHCPECGSLEHAAAQCDNMG